MKNTIQFKKEEENKYSEFWTNNDINLAKLSNEIALALNVKRWEDCEDKRGFSGLSMVDWDNPQKDNKVAKRMIVVNWADGGKEHGFNLNLNKKDAKIVSDVIKNHTT